MSPLRIIRILLGIEARKPDSDLDRAERAAAQLMRRQADAERRLRIVESQARVVARR